MSNNRYDFLHHTKRGRVCPYDAEKHGEWEIHEKEKGNLGVRLCREATGEKEPNSTDGEQSGTFALESHLRDYLARNLNKIADFGAPLELFVDQDGVDGVEYQTDVGPIDILARTENGDFYVFELKLGRGADAALGQILRYMGWVGKHLSGENVVHGIVLASEISKKLKYAVTQVPNVELLEYELSFSVKPIDEV